LGAENCSERIARPLLRKIAYWLEGRNREAETWREHREINMVMLATSLAPNGFLSL